MMTFRSMVTIAATVAVLAPVAAHAQADAKAKLKNPAALNEQAPATYKAKFDTSKGVFTIDVATGRRTLWKELAPPDRTGVNGILAIRITPDGRSYAYSYYQPLSDLFVVEGLK